VALRRHCHRCARSSTTALGHRRTTRDPATPRQRRFQHRRRARAEDRIRTAKNTGLTTLPLHGFAHNQIWIAIVALAVELAAWTQMLASTDHEARRWEPTRLRLRLYSIAGLIARHARRVHLRLAGHAPWADLVLTAYQRLPGHLDHAEHRKEHAQQPPVVVSSQAVTHTKVPGQRHAGAVDGPHPFR